MKSFLFLSESLIGLYIILICLIPIFILMIVAIVLTANKKRKEGKIREEKIKEEPVSEFQKEVFFEAYGGEDNIIDIKREMGRITVNVVDLSLVNGDKLKELGAKGVLLVGSMVKASFGDRAKYIYELLKVKGNGE
ncbi:MAG: hypothetical protein WC278_00225 [Bacilli bacterium]|nr:hypothetical protein [Bacilli bacterium]MDD2681373.1 hypothetical protein [Bacilli bacterium]MDD3120882.1 hypothetical protein [Bacilli bacterium]MDD4063077.1 hypothetical protein [Bacilli bacterium]MDD4481643.1 hypothetical protein [Bacilli bacterium]